MLQAQEHLEAAYALTDEGGFAEALGACDAVIELEPRLAEAHNLRGIALEALAAYRAALRLDPALEEARANARELASELAPRYQLVTVATFRYPMEAHLRKARLQALGIPSFLADEHLITINWLYSNAVGGVKLQVRRRDAARARRILRTEPYDPSLRGVGPQRPDCGSFDVGLKKYALRWVFLSWLLTFIPSGSGFPLLFRKGKWACRKCRHAWKSV
jgi:tetratricopeptide (TPR) repeat protein